MSGCSMNTPLETSEADAAHVPLEQIASVAQPEALRLADLLEECIGDCRRYSIGDAADLAAVELRRLHSENDELLREREELHAAGLRAIDGGAA